MEPYSSYFVGEADWWDNVAKGWEAHTFKIHRAALKARRGWSVDSGAWIGPTALHAADYATGVIALEPDPRAYEMLAANVGHNPSVAAKSRLHRLCLAATAAPVTLTFRGTGASGSTTAAGVFGADVPSFPAKCVPLAWLLEAHGVSKAPTSSGGGWALWKLDTEGGEADIFPAAVPLLEAYGWPIVHLSVHTPHWKDDPSKRAALLAAMRNYKYVYDGSLRRVDPLSDEHIKGFPDYVLSQVPLTFE